MSAPHVLASQPPDVDLVFEGGGIKGIALVGALEVLTAHGYRALRVAGTSAGAIVAALYVAGYTPEELRDDLLSFAFSSLRDTGWEDRVPVVGPLLSLGLDFGLYEGEALADWVRERLLRRGVQTFADLPTFEGQCRLQVVVSDVTERRILLLPRDAARLGVSPDELEVAAALRMSASLPLYFEPVRWRHPQTGREHLLVDGGLLSNFPVWAFDVPGTPRWPTLGLLLVDEHPRDALGGELLPPESGLTDYLKSLVSTVLQARDRQYLESADFVRTVAIPNLGVGTTEFDLSPERALALYTSGREAAVHFLET
ncbi:patatin-like phospholipase family protein [Deinococcus humi]|uniref:NTE family protein n=1 Tax=Deinococcus humi TaxID=662880 RepID=A0A7W8JT62_9DEIO|nr:patatin-like phospholipase family protein [Deinococcus humi]MBB5362780.1 NTE family protein [Deinococcus humi]